MIFIVYKHRCTNSETNQECLFIAVAFILYIMSSYQENITRHNKRQNHNLKGQSKHQNQTWQENWYSQPGI